MYTPLWKRLLIIAVVLAGFAIAMPNLFYSTVETHNDAKAAAEKAGVLEVEFTDGRLVLGGKAKARKGGEATGQGSLF